MEINVSQFEWDTVRACACVGAGSAVPCFDFSPLSVFAWVTCAARGFISDTIDASANWWLSRIKDKEERGREGERERPTLWSMTLGNGICNGNPAAHMSGRTHATGRHGILLHRSGHTIHRELI